MQNAILGMRYLNISQKYFSNNTHKNLYQIDLAGMDTGADTWRAKMYLKCLNILRYEETGFANTVFFGTCDKDGNMAPVHTPALGDVVLTLAMTHDNVISSKIKIGGVYSGDDMIYEEGITGNASGYHIHLDVTTGWVTKKIKYVGSQYYGGLQWAMPNLVAPEKALFLLRGYHETPINDGGYNWQWVDSIEYNGSNEGGNEVVITKDINQGVYGIDLSENDEGCIDWDKVAENNVKFAIIKCGFGADKEGQTESTFLEYCKKCDELGIKKGAYIYSYAENEEEAINEAKHIIRLCDEAGGDFPIGLFLDMEDNVQKDHSKVDNTKSVLAYIHQIWTTSYKAGFYSYTDFINKYVNIDDIVGNAIIWLANYGANDGMYHDITTNFDYDIRQFTSKNLTNISSRDGLDQNIHFAFTQHVGDIVTEEPIEPTDEPESTKCEECEQLKELLEQANAKINELQEMNDALVAANNGLGQKLSDAYKRINEAERGE